MSDETRVTAIAPEVLESAEGRDDLLEQIVEQAKAAVNEIDPDRVELVADAACLLYENAFVDEVGQVLDLIKELPSMPGNPREQLLSRLAHAAALRGETRAVEECLGVFDAFGGINPYEDVFHYEYVDALIGCAVDPVRGREYLDKAIAILSRRKAYLRSRCRGTNEVSSGQVSMLFQWLYVAQRMALDLNMRSNARDALSLMMDAPDPRRSDPSEARRWQMLAEAGSYMHTRGEVAETHAVALASTMNTGYSVEAASVLYDMASRNSRLASAAVMFLENRVPEMTDTRILGIIGGRSREVWKKAFERALEVAVADDDYLDLLYVARLGVRRGVSLRHQEDAKSIYDKALVLLGCVPSLRKREEVARLNLAMARISLFADGTLVKPDGPSEIYGVAERLRIFLESRREAIALLDEYGCDSIHTAAADVLTTAAELGVYLGPDIGGYPKRSDWRRIDRRAWCLSDMVEIFCSRGDLHFAYSAAQEILRPPRKVILVRDYVQALGRIAQRLRAM